MQKNDYFNFKNEEQKQEIYKFVEDYGLKQGLLGTQYIIEMLTYLMNYKTYTRIKKGVLVTLIAEKNNVSEYSVIRLTRYASYEANLKEPINIRELLYNAWFELKFKEENVKVKKSGNKDIKHNFF